MNRFIIERNVEDIAKSLCDQHIVKMPLEEAQMLCTTLWHHAPEYAEEQGLYKPVHQKHPCTLWAMENRANYMYAYDLYQAMLIEYTHRYGKYMVQVSIKMLCTLAVAMSQTDGRHHTHNASVGLIISRLTSSILSRHIVSSTRQTSSSLHDTARADPCLSGWLHEQV